jgi:hypothetical protein
MSLTLNYPKNLRGSDTHTIVFCLVYLPFDLNILSSRDPEGPGMDGSTFERNFEVARKTLSCGSTKDFEQSGSAFSARASAKVKGSSCIFLTHGPFHLSSCGKD